MMVADIELCIYTLVRRYSGVYLFNNEKKQKRLNPNTDLDTDRQLDPSEAEGLAVLLSGQPILPQHVVLGAKAERTSNAAA